MPDWVEPVWRYILLEGLQGMLRVAVVSLIGSTAIGIVLGTLLTIHFRPSRWLIRLYIEVFRGLPIIVTLFLVYYGLPPISPALQFSPLTATSIALVLWGSAQVAEASRGRSARSRTSNTRRPPRSASAGSAATATSSCRRRSAACCRRSSACS